jgi:alpha-D-ribose 1-methylphosphonate 5-triphosphate synthase subunit PhnH
MSIDLPGFADPVASAQACFRATLDALARPGSVHGAGAGLTPPDPLDPATAAVLLTLADAETPLWLGPGCEAARDWLAFHCGVAFALDIGAATFAVALSLPDLATMNAGTDEGPEESATLVLQVRGFGTGQALMLAGPGLAAPARLLVDGLPANFPALWAANHALFPRGVDIILCAGTSLAALPRSLAIREG